MLVVPVTILLIGFLVYMAFCSIPQMLIIMGTLPMTLSGGHMGGGMMLGMGIVGFLVLAAFNLLVATLIKYLFFW